MDDNWRQLFGFRVRKDLRVLDCAGHAWQHHPSPQGDGTADESYGVVDGPRELAAPGQAWRRRARGH
eukprot:10388529-Lingulodinium_polyedra.AAC.1